MQIAIIQLTPNQSWGLSRWHRIRRTIAAFGFLVTLNMGITSGTAAAQTPGSVDATYHTSTQTQDMRAQSFAVSGDGGVTAFHDNGGRILINPKLVLIFWGTAWTNPATTPSENDFINSVNNLVNGPWGTQLSQYHGIGRFHVEQTVTITSSNPPTVFTDPQIVSMLQTQINAGVIPAPDGSDRIYCVLMPTGSSSGDTPFVGQHQFFNRGLPIGIPPFSPPAFWAWVTNDGTLNSGNSIPKILSHELAEAVTDPFLGSGILVDTATLTNAEIGDVCNNTFSTINGFAEEAYWSQVDNKCALPVLQALPAIGGNPILIQSRFGAQGNFDLVVPGATSGLLHFFRNNDNAYLPLSAGTPFGTSLGKVDSVTMIQSNFGSPGNLELLARVGNQLFFFWRDSGPAFQWNGPFPFVTGVSGNPVLIQSRFGNMGNFELVVPSASGGLLHYYRNNDDPSLPWIGPTAFAGSLGNVDSVTMIQSNFGSPGNLELLARVGNQLFFFWRDSGPAFQWNGPFPFVTGVSGNPVLIQSRFGNMGNFELLVPSASGGLLHYYRNNDDPSLPWVGPTAFAGSLGNVDSVTMIQSNFGSPGNLEVFAQVGSQLYFLWRDSGPAFQWNGPSLVQSTVW